MSLRPAGLRCIPTEVFWPACIGPATCPPTMVRIGPTRSGWRRQSGALASGQHGLPLQPSADIDVPMRRCPLCSATFGRQVRWSKKLSSCRRGEAVWYQQQLSTVQRQVTSQPWPTPGKPGPCLNTLAKRCGLPMASIALDSLRHLLATTRPWPVVAGRTALPPNPAYCCIVGEGLAKKWPAICAQPRQRLHCAPPQRQLQHGPSWRLRPVHPRSFRSTQQSSRAARPQCLASSPPAAPGPLNKEKGPTAHAVGPFYRT